MYLTVDDNKVFAATGGKEFEPGKPCVIFIHGAGLDHTIWLLQSRWFAWHGWAVLAVDMPGHGHSAGDPLPEITDMAAWIGRLMDAAGIETASLIGHSMGAIIALEAAAALPDRIDRIALLGITATMDVHPMLLDVAKNDPAKAYEIITAWSMSPGAKVGRNPVPGIWMTGNALALFANNRPGTLHAALAAAGNWKTGPQTAKKVTCPAHVIVGKYDMMTPAAGSRELAGMIANCQYTELDDCGHILTAEAPDAVLDTLIDYLGAA